MFDAGAGPKAALPGPLHLAAQGAGRRHRAQPARAARRHRQPCRRARDDAHHVPSIAVRTGDTPAIERARFQREPADILITTPESLYLLLTSNAREALRAVDTVIIDEIHALVPTKRGAHLALSLERLEAIRPAGRGAAAAHRALGDAAAARRGGAVSRRRGRRVPAQPSSRRSRLRAAAASTTSSSSEPPTSYRAVTIVDTSRKEALDLTIEVPVEDMARIGQIEEIPSGPASQGPVRTSIWTAIHPRLLELIRAHRSTLIFVNSRRIAERLARGAQRARRRDAGALAPRLARAPAADRGRGPAQGRPAARPRRDLVARARHRHGRDRSRRPDRGAAVGRERHAADRPRRATRSARPAAASSSRSSAAIWSRARPSRARCTTAQIEIDAAIRAIRSTCWRSRSSRWWRWTTGRSTTCSPPSAAPRRSPT